MCLETATIQNIHRCAEPNAYGVGVGVVNGLSQASRPADQPTLFYFIYRPYHLKYLLTMFKIIFRC
jgi:hypothetical protein